MNRIIEVIYPNIAHRTFATTEVISETSYWSRMTSDTEKLSPELRSFYDDLMKLSGVVEVSLHRYEVGVTVAEAWASDEGWVELSLPIIKLIVDHFYKGQVPSLELRDKRPEYERSHREQRDWE